MNVVDMLIDVPAGERTTKAGKSDYYWVRSINRIYNYYAFELFSWDGSGSGRGASLNDDDRGAIGECFESPLGRLIENQRKKGRSTRWKSTRPASEPLLGNQPRSKGHADNYHFDRFRQTFPRNWANPRRALCACNCVQSPIAQRSHNRTSAIRS